MIKTIPILGATAVIGITYAIFSPPPSVQSESFPQSSQTLRLHHYSFEDLLNAIAIVESNNNPSAIGDNGRAVGLMQLWKIALDDVNRILDCDKYSYADRLDPIKSKAMVRIYLTHYATDWRIGRPPTFEDMARIHNGGPNGYKKESTKKYWHKVQKVMTGGRNE